MPIDGKGMYRHNTQAARMHGMKDPEPAKPDTADEPDKEDEGAHTAIHDHLTAMHEADGKAHTHIEHHGDGTHTSHHVDDMGEVHEPAHHTSAEELVDHLKMHLPEEEQEIAEGDEDSDEESQPMMHHSALGV